MVGQPGEGGEKRKEGIAGRTRSSKKHNGEQNPQRMTVDVAGKGKQVVFAESDSDEDTSTDQGFVNITDSDNSKEIGKHGLNEDDSQFEPEEEVEDDSSFGWKNRSMAKEEVESGEEVQSVRKARKNKNTHPAIQVERDPPKVASGK